jgi:hypothetical protein
MLGRGRLQQRCRSRVVSYLQYLRRIDYGPDRGLLFMHGAVRRLRRTQREASQGRRRPEGGGALSSAIFWLRARGRLRGSAIRGQLPALPAVRVP